MKGMNVMMVCENCGAELNEKFLFCNKCGTPIPSIQKAEGFSEEITEEFTEEYTEEFTEDTPVIFTGELAVEEDEKTEKKFKEEIVEDTVKKITEEKTEETVGEKAEVTAEEKKEERKDMLGGRVEALALQMKSLCDEMTAAYTDGMREIENAVASAKDKTDKNRTELQFQLTESRKENERLSAELKRLSEENRGFRNRVDILVQENTELRTQLEAVAPGMKSEVVHEETKTGASGDPTGRICPKCGTVMDDDMLFCTNCGNRLK